MPRSFIMATKPVKPKPAKSSPPRTKTASIKPEQAFVDPLADVPLHGPVTDRFTIQPGEIEFITVGSIEVITHPSAEEDETKPTTRPAGQPSKRPKDET
jgi:hypothetical protein